MKERIKKVLFNLLLIVIYTFLFQFVWNFGIAKSFNGIEPMDYLTAVKVWASLVMIMALTK